MRNGRGAYGITSTTSTNVPDGEPADLWPGAPAALGSGLRVFVRTIWEGCNGAVLDGDWVSSLWKDLLVYCPPTSAVGDAVWSSWYALYQDIERSYEVPVEPGRGFDFAAGRETVALFTGIPGDVLGKPIAIEYYVSGSDAWRPSSLQVRFPMGVPRYGISNANFTTRGELCWVDSDGQQFEQEALGCAYVGQSAKATLIDSEFSPTSTGAVAMGLHSSPRSPDSVYALLAHDQTSRPGTSSAKRGPAVTRYRLQSHGHEEESVHHGPQIHEHMPDAATDTHKRFYDLESSDLL